MKILILLSYIPIPYRLQSHQRQNIFGMQIFFYLLLRRSNSDHYLRSCGYVTCSRPQQTVTGGLEPGTSRPKVLVFNTAPVRSECICFGCRQPRHARLAIRDIAMPPNKSNDMINSFFTLPHTCSAVHFFDIYLSSLPYQKKETKIPISLFLKSFYNCRRNCFIDVQRHFEWNCGCAY